MPQFWYVFSRPDSGVEMDPEIADPYPRLGTGEKFDWVGGRRGAISPDRPEIAGSLPSIKWPQLLRQ